MKEGYVQIFTYISILMHRIFPVKYSTDAISPGKDTLVNNLSFGATMMLPANQAPGSETPWKQHGFWKWICLARWAQIVMENPIELHNINACLVKQFCKHIQSLFPVPNQYKTSKSSVVIYRGTSDIWGVPLCYTSKIIHVAITAGLLGAFPQWVDEYFCPKWCSLIQRRLYNLPTYDWQPTQMQPHVYVCIQMQCTMYESEAMMMKS